MMNKHVVPQLSLAVLLGIASFSSAGFHSTREALAQTSRAARNVRPPTEFWPVTVALVDDLPEARAEAYVLRRTDHFPSDVILLRRTTANGQRLAAAVASLLEARRQHGNAPTRNGRIAVLSHEGPRGWERSELPRAQRVVQRLRWTSPIPISGVGNAAAVTIYLRDTSRQAR